jgi:hypothetical protein
MTNGTRQVVALYVDRSSRQWVVRDAEGNFWRLPAGERAWEQRQPFTPTEATALEPIPGHYQYLLDVPW